MLKNFLKTLRQQKVQNLSILKNSKNTKEQLKVEQKL